MFANISFPDSIRLKLKPCPSKRDFFNNYHYHHDNVVVALEQFSKHMVVKYFSLTTFFFRYRSQCLFLLQYLEQRRIKHERRYVVFYPNEIELGADGVWRRLMSNSSLPGSLPSESDVDNDSITLQTTSTAKYRHQKTILTQNLITCYQRCRCCVCFVAAKNIYLFHAVTWQHASNVTKK